jgi:deoxyadenosine/deoxycytidine kinase
MSPAPPFRHIAVEGPIGVGKTSFVELLARKFDAHRVLEQIDNPFLDAFYQDKSGAAFQAQLFFLLSRYRQLQDLSQRDLFSQITLLDYIFP